MALFFKSTVTAKFSARRTGCTRRRSLQEKKLSMSHLDPFLQNIVTLSRLFPRKSPMLACLMTSDQTSTTTITATTTTSRPYSLCLAHRPAVLTRANPVPMSCKVLPIIHHTTLCPVLGFSKHLWQLAPARALSAGASPKPECDTQREATRIKADSFSISSSNLPFKSKLFRFSRRLKPCHHP